MYLEISNPMDYHVALYIRLSKEDENEGPSQSVQNQESLLREFVQQHRLSVFDTYVDEEEAPNEFAALFQTEKELLQIRLQLDDDLTIQSILSSASDEWICPFVLAVLIAADAMRGYGVSDWDAVRASTSFIS